MYDSFFAGQQCAEYKDGKRQYSEGDRPDLRLSPSGLGQGDSTLPYTASSRSATELTWGDGMDGRCKTYQRAATMIRTRAARPRMTISMSLSLSLPAAKS